MSKAIYNRLSVLNNRRVNNANRRNQVIMINQADFDNGTYLITAPGVYRLAEDISFNPNNLNLAKTVGLPGSAADPSATSWDTGMPVSDQFTHNGGKYDVRAFGIGFFAAIVISCENVTLDLDGHTIEQSAEHALQQKFYSHVELADQPFIPKQGPHNFGNIIKSAKNVCVMNGKFGNSSHHAIHGNDNVDVLIQDLIFEKQEVATIALNNVKGAAIVNCHCNHARQNTPVLAIFSAARFLRNHLDALAAEKGSNPGGVSDLTVNGVTKTAIQVRDELKTAINNVFDDVVTNAATTGGFIDKAGHGAEWSLFHNPFSHIDGNCYGLVINSRGVAVFGFPENRDTRSSDVYLADITINRIENTVNEIPALAAVGVTAYTQEGVDDPLGCQNDSTGAVFQTVNKDDDGLWNTINNLDAGAGNGKYLGNVVANAQLMILKNKDNSAMSHLDLTRLSITPSVLAWAEAGTNLLDVIAGDDDLYWIGNGDGMFHVNKGLVGFKLDGLERFTVKNCIVNHLTANGGLGTTLAGDYSADKSHPLASLPGYGGAALRGFSLSSAADGVIVDCSVRHADSKWGSVTGFDIMHASERLTLENCTVENIAAGSAATIDQYLDNPTAVPVACGYHIDEHAKSIVMKNVYMKGVNTSVGTVMKMNLDCDLDRLSM